MMNIKPFLFAVFTAVAAVPSWSASPGDVGFSLNKGQLPIIDSQGRELILQGLGSGSGKHTEMRRARETAETVEFQAKVLGYNTHRYLIFWDHIMPNKGVINTAYLDDIESRLDWFADNKMHVILDMHQDNWSEVCDGNGAPAWATVGAAEPAPGAPWWILAASPCVIDSVNLFYENHEGWMDEYVNSWAAVAERFKDHPAVFGYDLMNEPNKATAIIDQMVYEQVNDTDKTLVNTAVKTTVWVNGTPENALESVIKSKISDLASANGVPVPDSYINKITKIIIARNQGDWGSLTAVEEFEGGDLTNFYQKLINRIRLIDQDKFIFVEPMSLSVNNGFKTWLGDLHDPGTNGRRLGYIPHMYPRALHEGGAYSDHDYSQVVRWQQTSQHFVHEKNMAFLLGEFGHSNTAENGVQFLKDAVRMAERNKLGWEYWDSGSDWGPYNEKTYELQANAEALINIYPRAVAGRIEDYRYQREDKTFQLNYFNKAGVSGTTDISIPANIYSNGFVVESTDEDNTWSYSYDSDFGILSISHDPSVNEHTITIKPNSETQVARYRELLNVESDLCLNMEGMVPAAGKNIKLRHCTGKNWQSWAYDEENQMLRNFQNPEYCLSHYGPSEAKNNGAVSMALCAEGGDDVRWIMDTHGNSAIIRNIYNPQIVLDANGSSVGDNITQWNELNGKNQYWKWGWKDANASMTTLVSSMKKGQPYNMHIMTKAEGCGLEVHATANGNNERNAKFDCNRNADLITFNATSDPIENPNGSLSITGSLFSIYNNCGLEWDADITNGGTNAKWDCNKNSDPVTLTTASLGSSVVIGANGCGLEWDANMDNNGERNAKWDCQPNFDAMKLEQVEPAFGTILGEWTQSSGRNQHGAGNPSYILTIAKNSRISINLMSNVDTYLYVEEITTGWTAENDDGGQGTNSSMSFATYEGSGFDYYRITAATYKDAQVGEFTIQVSDGLHLVPESEFQPVP